MMDDREFQECPECAAKPGAPDLCSTCVHNRRVVSYWQGLAEQWQGLAQIQQRTIDRYVKLLDYRERYG